SLGTADGVQIPETELLSFILFGQPSFEFGGGILPGAGVFENIFVGGITQLAAVQLEEAVLRDLGLPLYQFEIRTGVGGQPWLTAPIFVFGFQVAEDLYITVESGFGMIFGGTGVLTDDWSVSLEWQIDPEWTLLLGYEPLSAVRLFRPSTTPLPTTAPQRQFVAEIRRRWTY
ncbi:MAG TPA: hypothetical protein VNZ57_08500, partial [Longimicrobiales bacterium]|nr:hypothetical protein [Longimicrobiales bacterium]